MKEYRSVLLYGYHVEEADSHLNAVAREGWTLRAAFLEGESRVRYVFERDFQNTTRNAPGGS